MPHAVNDFRAVSVVSVTERYPLALSVLQEVAHNEVGSRISRIDFGELNEMNGSLVTDDIMVRNLKNQSTSINLVVLALWLP